MSEAGQGQGQKEKAVGFLTLVASGNVREAYDRYIGPGFRHHNAYFRGDANSLMAAMEENAEKFPNKAIEVKRALEEGDSVMVYSHIKHEPGALGAAVVHIFRFENGRVAELWDLGQAIPEDSPNENGMF